MSVFLNSTPQEDGQALNGGAVSVGNIPGVYFVADYNVVTYREESQGSPQYLSMVATGEFVGVWGPNGTYLEAGDTGFTFRWKFWARGTGTIALTQDGVWDTSALPATSIGNLVVSSGSWALYDVPAGAIDLTHFLAYDGERLGLACTSGAVDITTIQLECVPDSGTTGWWTTQPTQDIGGFVATANSVHGAGVGDSHDTDRQTAWDAGYGQALAASPLLEDDPTALDLESLGNSISTGAPSNARSGPDTVPADSYFGEFFLGARKTWVNEGGGYPVLSGDEGVDYIRVPGYVIVDGGIAYSRSAANYTNPPSSHVDWDDPHVEFTRANSFEQGAWEDTTVAVTFYIVEEEPHLNTAPIDWSDRGSALVTMTPVSATPQLGSISLPSSGIFAIYAVSTGLDGSAPTLPDPGANVGIYWSAGMEILSGSTTTGGVDELTYSKHFDSFAQWDPFATPPGGKLKLRMSDDTWRILGNPADTGGRLKLQTPDSTWWKEYRTVDGAVTTHPLKLYTTDGWVVVADMTPD